VTKFAIMLCMLFHFILNVIAMYLTSNLIKGIKYKGTLSLLGMVAVIALLNVLLRPLLFLLTLPITFITLGLFIFILNGIIFYLASRIIKDYEVENITTGVLAWITYSFFAYIFSLTF
jgi:putative membrane protein